MTKDELIKLGLRLELARRDFFYFCKTLAPDFYSWDREFLVKMCGEMQEFIENEDEKVMIVNVPPRHGKSRTASLLAQWLLGRDNNAKIMTGSYNETLSTSFSKSVRNSIMEEKADMNKIVFNDIFPLTRIKRGDASMNLWSLEGGYNNYLATSPTGTATGFGCSVMIIDDLIKNELQAFNDRVLEGHWEWFTNTMLSRLEEGGKIIIIMTRWSTNDLAGRSLRHFKELGMKVRHINMKALQDDGTMLCDQILSKQSYDMRKKTLGEAIMSANYQQEPINIKGQLYSSFKTYEELPDHFERIASYTDTADTGTDYLCHIIFGEYKGQAYILDVYYTQDDMSITEEEVALRSFQHKVNYVLIESNNGGRGFARAVERILNDKYKGHKCVVDWFHQSQNKKARILSNSTWVMENLYFPKNWNIRWSDYYSAMISYQRMGTNANDDAPDCTTGVCEMVGNKRKFRTISKRALGV